jgi:hypothetical protein
MPGFLGKQNGEPRDAMALQEVVDGLFEDQTHKIRIDKLTKEASVLDVIRLVTGAKSKDAGITFRRLGDSMATKCRFIKINGVGKETPVSDARTLVEIIWSMNAKGAKDFRRQSAHNICRLLGADVSLAREIEARSTSIPQEQKDFFLEPQTTTVSLYKRKTMKVGDSEFEVPNENDSPALQERLWRLIDRAGEQQLAASQRTLDAEFERRMVVVNEESEHRLALSRKSHEKELEEIDRDLETGRSNHKRTMDQFAIENCQLVAKRTKAVKHVLETLKECELIHPSLMTAAIGSISNMAAQAAGVGLSLNGEPSHLEDFSTMAEKISKSILSLSHLSAIGKLVAKEYRSRYNGQDPERIRKQVNGDMRPVFVYQTKDREWIEDILRTYIGSIPQKSKTKLCMTN